MKIIIQQHTQFQQLNYHEEKKKFNTVRRSGVKGNLGANVPHVKTFSAAHPWKLHGLPEFWLVGERWLVVLLFILIHFALIHEQNLVFSQFTNHDMIQQLMNTFGINYALTVKIQRRWTKIDYDESRAWKPCLICVLLVATAAIIM